MAFMTYDEMARIDNLSPEEILIFANGLWVIEKNGWINIEPGYVLIVLENVKNVFAKWFTEEEIDSKKVSFVNKKTKEECPVAFPKKGIISLCMDLLPHNDGCKLIYQSSHELTHIFLGCRPSYKNIQEYKWFEETICELASLAVLDDAIWQTTDALGFISNMRFAKQYLQTTIKDVPEYEIEQVANIFMLESEKLSQNSYMREINILFACEIRKIVAIDKAFWDCIKIFTEIDGQGIPIEDSFKKWYELVPLESKEIVAKIISVFGVEVKANMEVTT